MKCWESRKERQVLNNPNDNRRSEPSYDCLETEWSSWLTDGFRQEKKERSWPSQAHDLGLLAVIWMVALSLQLFGVNKLCMATGSKCVGRVDIYIRPYWKISSRFHSRLLDSPFFIVSFLTIFLASTWDLPASDVCTASIFGCWKKYPNWPLQRL